METLDNPRFTYFQDYENELSLGDSPLVPYVGWLAAYDRWEECHGRNERGGELPE